MIEQRLVLEAELLELNRLDGLVFNPLGRIRLGGRDEGRGGPAVGLQIRAGDERALRAELAAVARDFQHNRQRAASSSPQVGTRMLDGSA